MKSFINKINQYLLERYPTIWNLRLVWVLGVTTLFHLLFFLIGFCLYRNPAKFSDVNINNEFFNSGLFGVSMITSTLILVVWIVYLIKNNAFKSFYPTRGISLFMQFIAYFGVILYAITFFFSYHLGLICFVKTNYPDELVRKEINLINNTMPFLPFDIEEYELDKKMYPSPFDTLYCETDYNKIDFSKPYKNYLDSYYQFYTVERQSIQTANDIDDLNIDYIIYHRKNDVYDLLQKGKLVNISKYIDDVKPSFLNCNKTFMDYDSLKGKESYIDYSYGYLGEELSMTDRKFNGKGFTYKQIAYNVNKHTVELLKQGNKNLVKNQLHEFLELSKKYQIPNDLNEEIWLGDIYKGKNFSVEFLLLSKNPNPLNHDEIYESSSYVAADAAVSDSTREIEKTDWAKYSDDIQTTHYYQIGNLYKIYQNVEDIKSTNHFAELIQIFLWFALAVAALLFLFRTSGLKPLILAFISGGIIFILAIIIVITVDNILDGRLGYHHEENILLVGAWLFCVALLISATALLGRIKKLISAILLNLSIVTPLLIYGFSLVLINMMQRDSWDYENEDRILYDANILVLSVIGFIISLLYVLYYCYIIKKWKALPES